MVKKAADKDIRRTVREQFKRFLSIVMITLLGVMMFSGLKASCEDLRISADTFFDAQKLHDIWIQSTLGISENDLEALNEMEDTEAAEGIFAKDVSCMVNGEPTDLSLETLPEKVDIPYVKEGRLPENMYEAAVTVKFVHDTGAGIGGIISFDDEDFDTAAVRITGIVVDPRDVNNPNGSVSYRTAMNGKNTIYLTKDAVTSDIYTAAAVTVKGTKELRAFTDEYKTAVREYRSELEKVIKPEREQARTDEVKDEAQQKIDDAEKEAKEELEDAEKELNDAEQEWADGKQELEDAEEELKEKKEEADREISDAQKEIDDNRRKLEDAKEEIADAEKEIEENKKKLKDAEKKIRDAEKEIADGRKKLSEAQKELDDKKADAKQEINDARVKLNDALKQTSEGIAQAESAKLQFHEALGQLGKVLPGSFDAYEQAYEDAYYAALTKYGEDKAIPADVISKMGSSKKKDLVNDIGVIQAELAYMCSQLEQAIAGYTAYGMAAEAAAAEAQKSQLETMSASLDMVPDAAAGLAKGKGTKRWLDDQVSLLAEKEKEALQAFEDGQKEIDDNTKKLDDAEKELDDAKKEYNDGVSKLEDGEKELEDAKQEVTDGTEKLEEGQQELNDKKKEAEDKIADAEKEIADAREELDDAREDIDEGWEEYYDGKKEAEEKIQDARDELAEIEDAVWYVQDRAGLSGYANIESDAASIESIGTVFPIIFFVVAILISLTAVTRMVEEERGLIGTYKSIGYRDSEIVRKYILFSVSAAMIGSLLGTVMAFVALPMFICTFFDVMYLVPEYEVHFIPLYGAAGPLLFILGILTAVVMSCMSELKQVPAALMRPKAPRAGAKTLMEKIPFIWTRLSFLNKVTARNIFRYKKRMFMTVFGIAGCMTLLLFGFAIKDSVRDLMPRQYQDTTVYDVMAVVDTDERDEVKEKLDGDTGIEDMTEIMVTNVRLEYGGREESMQMIVIRDPEHFRKFVHLNGLDDKEITAEDGTVYITQNASNILHFDEGEKVNVQQTDLSKASVKAGKLVRNYLGNYIYMTEKTYYSYFEDLSYNGWLITNTGDADSVAFANTLKKDKNVISTMCTQEIRNQFSQAFRLINVVVYIIIGMSAALAFVVLFTLSATNISEREREIATIKVLGLFDREVHSYIDRETMFLTLFGIILGVPLGYLFAQTLTSILNIPSMYLAVSLHPISYVISVGLSLLFAVLVNLVMDRTLDHIEPAEALKSIE